YSRRVLLGDFASLDVQNTYRGSDAYEAASFCTWLAKKTGLPFKLPTEAQWMYVATDKGTMIYPTDNGKLEPCKNIRCVDLKGPQVVGQYPPNPMGVDFMMTFHQWTQDWYGDGYYWVSPKDNPQGPSTGTQKTLVGGYYVFYRMGGNLPGDENGYSGEAFRCVINTLEPIYPNKLMKAPV
ncbi:formylglycine-generating enzyme family protein, partial [Piscirickettsia salmonis]